MSTCRLEMKTTSMLDAPASTLRWWGKLSAPAFDFAAHFLRSQGCTGPSTWKEGALVPFSMVLGPTIKARISLCTFSADNGYAAFDCSAVIYSKTIHGLSDASDPWMGGTARPVFAGYTPCLVLHLAHLKWCEREGTDNPSWAMTLAADTGRPNVHAWAEDYARLFTPLLGDLTTDDSLEALLSRSLTKNKPRWVKSDAPYFVWLPSRLERLKSRSGDNP